MEQTFITGQVDVIDNKLRAYDKARPLARIVAHLQAFLNEKLPGSAEIIED